MPTDQLTERQREIYRIIVTHFRDHGHAPTVREVCGAAGFSSPNAIRGHLAALHRGGLIVVRSNGTSRGIEVPALAKAVRETASSMLADGT